MNSQKLTVMEKDIKYIIEQKYDESVHDLLNMVLLEDVPELLKYIRRMEKILNEKLPDGVGKYYEGYSSAIADMQRWSRE